MIPWRLQKWIANTQNFLHFLLAKSYYSPTVHGYSVDFNIPEYGITGGALAIINTANLLAENHTISFNRSPFSDKNKYLSKQVSPHPKATPICCIVESGISPIEFEKLKNNNIPIIVSNHGYFTTETDPNKNYGYSNKAVNQAFEKAKLIHFISPAQKAAYEKLEKLPKPSVVIQNHVDQIKRKNQRTHAIGIVCDTRLPLKNAASAIKAGEHSKAKKIEVWGRFNHRENGTKITYHGFSTNKIKIYNSFDVLVLLSYTEVQPLCILEAISCGLPCVLSDLPCYLEFRNLPGFWFVDPNSIEDAANAINEALGKVCKTSDVAVGCETVAA